MGAVAVARPTVVAVLPGGAAGGGGGGRGAVAGRPAGARAGALAPSPEAEELAGHGPSEGLLPDTSCRAEDSCGFSNDKRFLNLE
jgi:hypothetical protein